MATQRRLTVRKDTDLDETVTITDQSTGDPLDVTNDTIKNHVIDDAGATILSLEVGTGITKTNATAGIITIAYDSATVNALATGEYRRYLLVNHASNCLVVLDSQFVVLPSVGSC